VQKTTAGSGVAGVGTGGEWVTRGVVQQAGFSPGTARSAGGLVAASDLRRKFKDDGKEPRAV